MSFCMGSLSVHHCFRQKGAYGSGPATSLWPRVSLLRAVSMTTCPRSAGLWYTGRLVMFTHALDKRNFRKLRHEKREECSVRRHGSDIWWLGGQGGGGFKVCFMARPPKKWVVFCTLVCPLLLSVLRGAGASSPGKYLCMLSPWPRRPRRGSKGPREPPSLWRAPICFRALY